MTALLSPEVTTPLTLTARTAEDLMTPNPVSIRADATVKEALAVLIDKGFGAAPVMDEAGRPIGVVSRTDFLAHDHEKAQHRTELPDTGPRELPTAADQAQVRDIMTPVVFSVAIDTPAEKVVSEM